MIGSDYCPYFLHNFSLYRGHSAENFYYHLLSPRWRKYYGRRWPRENQENTQEYGIKLKKEKF